MWQTQDGFTLTIPRSTLEAFASEAEAEAGGCAGCARTAVLDELEKMSRSARRSGSVKSKRTGRKYGTFSGKSGGRSFRMVTKPVGPRRAVIMGVRPWPLGPGWGPGCADGDCPPAAPDDTPADDAADGDDADTMLG